MKNIKKYIISLAISLSLMLIFSFFINLFNYFELFNQSIYKIVLVLLISFSTFIGGFFLGKNTTQKGYLNGLIYGIIICLILLFISTIIFNNQLNTSSYIYYLIIMIVSTISSVIGINKNRVLE